MVTLTVRGPLVVGELLLSIPPGTVAKERERLIDEALSGPLTEAATGQGAVLSAAPHRFARTLPGVDAEGRTRFVVGARLEGGRLVPDRHAGPRG